MIISSEDIVYQNVTYSGADEGFQCHRCRWDARHPVAWLAHDWSAPWCLWYLINIVLLRTKGWEKSVLDWVSRYTDAARKHNMKTQLLLMTSLQSPTLWRGFTFGGQFDRYCERTANIRPCGFRSTYCYFLGLPYTKGYDWTQRINK